MRDARSVPATREIRWDGFFNARDLGGLPTRAGQTTRHGVFVRSADLRFVTEAGWRAARDYGIRTVLDLRNDDEVMAGPQWWRGRATSPAAQPNAANPFTQTLTASRSHSTMSRT
ncbi:MAG: tyrosine-protein phosphatase, partial [Actinoallomurus sp.]